MVTRALLVGVGLLVLAAAPEAVADARGDAAQANRAPRITALSARIGRVYEEGRGPRNGGLRVRFTLCDDGPENEFGVRYARIRLSHRWGTRRAEALFVRESADLITHDIHFAAPECVRRIPWDSVLPADLRTSFHPCYAVTLRVRDPAGLWSKPRTRVVRECVPGRS